MNRLIPFALLTLSAPALAQSTAFTYQGQLKSSGQPATGTFDLQFKLFDAATGGTQQGSTVCADNVSVAAGLFTLQLDFGQQFITPTPRFLEINIRPDTGLDCTSATGFVTLSRQPITAAPLADHAKSAYALDAANGSAPSAVFVDNSGRVGIGTTTPSATLHVNGNVGVGNANIPAGLTTELGGSTPVLNLDVNFRQPNHNPGAVGGAIRLDSRSDLSDPLFQFISRPAGSSIETMVAALTQAGNLGLGTAAPAARLEVRGDIKLGASGQFFATSGDENLRIIRGKVNTSGTVGQGSGFTVTHVSQGVCDIHFNIPFSAPPTVTLGKVDDFTTDFAEVSGPVPPTASTVEIDACCSGREVPFYFIAIGPR